MYTTHAFSPIVEGDLAVFHLGGHDQGAVTAFDIASGNLQWSWAGDGPSYGSPIVATIGGTKQVITITQTKVVGVDVGTGALLWERPFVHPNVGNSNTPILYRDTIIVSGNLGPTVAFTAAKNGAAWTTTTVWENPDVPLRLTNLVLMGDMLFGITNRNAGQVLRDRRQDGQDSLDLTAPPGRHRRHCEVRRLPSQPRRRRRTGRREEQPDGL